MWPDPTIRYRRAEHVHIWSRPGMTDRVWDGTGWQPIPNAFRLLAQFDAERTPASVLDAWTPPCGGVDEAVELLRSVARLIEAGSLVACGASRPGLPERSVGRSERTYHAGMLADIARVDAFIDAVRAAVQPGDVVVDAGTGSGLLALAAAKAGARRVYAIESAGIADVAERLFRENGVRDQVEIIRGDASRVELPEAANVFISETVGANPFDEGILPIVKNLRRQLAPDARLVPERISLLVLPIEMPGHALRNRAAIDSDLDSLRQRYGFSFESLSLPRSGSAGRISADDALGWALAPDPLQVVDAVLATEDRDPLAGQAAFVAARDGTVTAIAMGFELDCGGGRRLSSLSRDDRPASWDVAVVRLDQPCAVRRGDALVVGLQQPFSGEPPVIAVRVRTAD